MKLPPAWRELIDSLISHRVRFLIVGAHALAAHGRPRATQDLDLFVDPTLANAKRLGAALADFGYPALARAWKRFATRDRMATLGVEPLRIDIMTSISGVSFSRAWKRRARIDLDGNELGFLGRDELLLNKRSAARPKDLLDLALLEEVDERPRARRRKGKVGRR